MFDKSEIMKAAWHLMRKRYSFNGANFKSIGFGCLGWCIREAWRQARAAARFAMRSVAEVIVQIESLKSEIERATYRADYGSYGSRHSLLKDELFELKEVAARAGLSF